MPRELSLRSPAAVALCLVILVGAVALLAGLRDGSEAVQGPEVLRPPARSFQVHGVSLQGELPPLRQPVEAEAGGAQSEGEVEVVAEPEGPEYSPEQSPEPSPPVGGEGDTSNNEPPSGGGGGGGSGDDVVVGASG